jgi:glycosyltransferase involved in cell wall biosynthesis
MVLSDHRNTLVLLTAAYPFGNKWEVFLDAELRILAHSFGQIIVLPSSSDRHVRALPPGVRYETVLADIGRSQIARELLRKPGLALAQYGRAIFEEESPSAYLRHPVPYFGVVGLNLLKYRALKELVDREGLQEALFYDYWLANSTVALSRLRRQGIIRRAVARAHGFDLYDEQSELGSVPFRAFVVASLDRIFTVSDNGLAELSARYPRAQSKLLLSRLGVESHDSVNAFRGGDLPLVVSCGGLLPIKRVEAVPDVLERIGRPLRWVHFGDGPTRGEVERAARSLPEHVTWHLAGHVDRVEVLDYYKSHKVALFISLSESEGVPVSIMEAISFGVPVLATAVGGVPEIVTRATGTVVALDDSVDAIAREARRLLDGDGPSTDEIIAFFKSNFDAERNFTEFAQFLIAV